MTSPKRLNLLVVYGTTEGQTRKIATRTGEFIRAAHHDVEVVDSTQVQATLDVDDYDGVIVLGSVHQGQYQSALVDFISSHLDKLQAKHTAFASVGLSFVFDEHDEEAQQYVKHLSTLTGWYPNHIEYVAGALAYTQYDFFKRQMMKLIARHQGGPTLTDKDYEFTDWHALEKFVDEYCRSVIAASPYSIS